MFVKLETMCVTSVHMFWLYFLSESREFSWCPLLLDCCFTEEEAQSRCEHFSVPLKSRYCNWMRLPKCISLDHTTHLTVLLKCDLVASLCFMFELLKWLNHPIYVQATMWTSCFFTTINRAAHKNSKQNPVSCHPTNVVFSLYNID